MPPPWPANVHRTADRTLQAVVDAVSRLDRLDDLIPEVLRTLMEAFDGTFSAHFEYADDGTVFPRLYCDRSGAYQHFSQVPGAERLPAAHRELLAGLARGFRLPPEYMGTPPEQVVRPMTLSHRRGTAVPQFDAVALAMGWSDELLCPLVANGRAFGKLAVYRGSGVDFAPADLVLAGSVAKYLSLVVQTRRLAEAARGHAAGPRRPRPITPPTRCQRSRPSRR